MARKEWGPMYTACCPECGSELTVGWIPDGPASQPALRDPTKRRPASVNVQGMTTETQTCDCGKVTLSLHPEAHRGVVEWSTAEEPLVGSTTTHGSLRDRVR